MKEDLSTVGRGPRNSQHALWRALVIVGAVLACLSSGCASLLNPATGIPANRLPREVLGKPKANLKTIDLALLGQKQPDSYKLAPGDVLGIWIEGVLGERGALPPVQLTETGKEPPSLGYPVPVRENGTLALPLVAPVTVSGMSIDEAEAAITRAYTEDKRILQPGRERIIVTLMRKRKYHILVVRQESGAPPISGGGSRGGLYGTTNVLGGTKQGTGHALDLPAYQNDVLNALVETGGLPGVDAVNEIVIERGVFGGEKDRELLRDRLEETLKRGGEDRSTGIAGHERIRIPLKLAPGQEPGFKPDDIILYTGDVIFIESRNEFFSTGGLLPSGLYPLPRDYDLDVLGAMALVGGPIANGGFNQNNLSGTIVASGVSDITPSMLVILRKTPGGGQIPIRVDLNEAIRDPRHRILVQPGDLLVLQQTPGEAVARYITGKIGFSYSKAWGIVHGNTATSASGSGSFP